MRWSLPIGRISGITLRLHVTFLIFLGWVVFSADSAVLAKWELLRVCLIFACVALHEFGHSLVAQQLGVEVRSITLLPIGGVAALRRLPENSWHEIAITMAGPLVNAVIAAVLLPLAGWPTWSDFVSIPVDFHSLIRALAATNIALLVFNLIPAFPMDGGRLFRAGLGLVCSYRRATAIAALAGQGLAILFMVFGWRHEAWVLLLIGLFIFFAADGEEKAVRLRSLLAGYEVGDLMRHEFATLAPTDTVECGLRRVYQTGQDDFPVVENGRLLGMASRRGLVEVVNKVGPHRLIGQVMDVRFLTVQPQDQVTHLQDEVLNAGWGSVPVVENGRLVGLLTADNINRFLLLQAGVKAKRRSAVAWRTPTPPPVIGAVPPIADPPLPAAPPPPTAPV